MSHVMQPSFQGFCYIYNRNNTNSKFRYIMMDFASTYDKIKKEQVTVTTSHISKVSDT
jgi:hypothetical protein